MSDDAQEDHLRDNCQAILDRLEPFEELLVTEANLSVLERSDKGTHKATIWFDIEPADLGMRPFSELIMPLHLHLAMLHVMARERLDIEDRDERIQAHVEAAEAGDTTAQEALDAIRAEYE